MTERSEIVRQPSDVEPTGVEVTPQANGVQPVIENTPEMPIGVKPAASKAESNKGEILEMHGLRYRITPNGVKIESPGTFAQTPKRPNGRVGA